MDEVRSRPPSRRRPTRVGARPVSDQTEPEEGSLAPGAAPKQYDLFTRFFGDPNQLSNTIELYDAIPKFAISARAQVLLRDSKGNLPMYEQEFLYRPTAQGLPKEVNCRMSLQPASIKNADGSYTQYYPSRDEEMVSEVLVKLFSDQQYGSHNPDGQESWVRFSLSMIQSELSAMGKTRSFDEIKRSIEILSRAVYEVRLMRSTKNLLYTNPLLTDVTGVTRSDYLSDPKSMWVAKLPVLISKSVNEVTYRQFNYRKLMGLHSQLARWLLKRLSHQYTQASLVDPYTILFSSIKRDSGLLNRLRMSSNVKMVKAALDELIQADVLMSVKEEERRHGTKILDMLYTMLPTQSFRDEVRAANARQTQSRIRSRPMTGPSSRLPIES